MAVVGFNCFLIHLVTDSLLAYYEVANRFDNHDKQLGVLLLYKTAVLVKLNLEVVYLLDLALLARLSLKSIFL